MIKRIAAVNDLSGLGRCSLSAALPILSAMGHQCCAVPTAVLSSQTDGYENYLNIDMTPYLRSYLSRWTESGELFDAVSTGYLGSCGQAELLPEYICGLLKPNGIFLCDPVMGDYGRPYDVCSSVLCSSMRALAFSADIITPNLTEAFLLLGGTYTEALTVPALFGMAEALCGKGPSVCVITGVPMPDGTLASAVFDAKASRTHLSSSVRFGGNFPGCGDVFACVLLGGMLGGKSAEEAADLACEFVRRCAEYTFSLKTPVREGLLFEPMLRYLL